MNQQDIDALIKAQVGTDTGATSDPNLAQAQANDKAAAEQNRDRLNQSLIANYSQGFSNWSAQVLNGKIDNTNPPQPPAAWLALTASDGWTYLVRGTDPVCPVPPIPSVPKPAPPVSVPVHVMDVTPGDTAPIGYVITNPADGTRWQKKATPTPFGVAMYYEQVV